MREWDRTTRATISRAPVIAVNELRDTISARWMAGLAGDPRRNAHWLTRVGYYRAVVALVESGVDRISWHDVVDRVAPRGCRTTFYEVAGARPKQSLHRAFSASGDPDVMQLALCYQRRDAVARLIDEAKVWSYWDCREAAIGAIGGAPARQATPEDRVGRMFAVFEGWVSRHPALAAALDCAPPMCVAEDLVAVRRPAIAGLRAFATLSRLAWDTLRPGHACAA